MESSPLSTSGTNPATIPAGVRPHGHVRSPSGTSTHSAILGSSTSNGVGGSAASRSLSMNSVSSEGSNESNLVEQEEIVALTQDVRGLKEALSKLRRIFHPERDKQESLRVVAHERLGEVLRILRTILDKYPPLQSTELLMAAGQLIQQVKGYDYHVGKCNQTDFFTTIDQLALAFSSRVSEYLMGDIDTSSALHPATRIRSCENLTQTPGDLDALVSSPKDSRESEILSPEEIDAILMKIDNGVNVALYRAKVWSKYAKDIITYIDKRANIEADYSRSLSKLAQNTRQALKDESCLPLQSIYCTALDQDISNANDGLAMCAALQEYKFVEPLTARRVDHEKQRKQIKELWHREFKKMQEAISNLRKAKIQYFQRNQEYEKAKESLFKTENTEGIDVNKIDKKKKLEEDAAQKVLEAESNYKECVEMANTRQQCLENTKADVLRQVRELVLQCDTTMKAVTVTYFQMQHTFSAPAPVKFQTLCESSRLYEPGAQYLEFVKRYSNTLSPNHVEHTHTPFIFECYSLDSRSAEKERKSIDSCEMSEEGTSPNRVDSKDKAQLSQTTKVWNPAVTGVMGSDSDSIGSSQSNKSRDTSPTASPQVPGRRILSHASSGDELDMIESENLENGYRRPCISKAASTHALRKLKAMAKCRECDTYVYFQGVECTRCGLACHKKCLEALAIQCGHKKLPRKMTTFGVDLQSHAQESQVLVPHLVSKCVSEIDRRGSEIKGIYRVSGVKSRIEKLCQSFENGANLVDLSDVHPNVIANVLKLYLRQLPEPLLTFPHYPDFIRIAKDYQTRTGDDNEAATLQELKEVVSKLKPAHYSTLSTLIQHLRRVANLSDVNNMPPSNLGIVFGPTLLRTIEGGASLASLVDTCHQAKVVELLIQHATEIFQAEPTINRCDKINELGKNLLNSSQRASPDVDVKAPNVDSSHINMKAMERTAQTGPSKRKPMFLPLQLPLSETDSMVDVLKASPCSCDDISPSLADKGEWAAILPSDDEPYDSLSSEILNVKSVHLIPGRTSQDVKPISSEETASSAAPLPLNSIRSRILHLDDSSDKITSSQTRNSGFSTLERQKLPLASTSSTKAEKSKVQVPMTDAVTQTDVSFLRNLASSPVPSARKHNQPIVPPTGCVKGGLASTTDKIVIHVAGPKDVALCSTGNTSKAKTFSKETQSSDFGSDVKTVDEDGQSTVSKDSLDNSIDFSINRLKTASSQVSLVDLEIQDKSVDNVGFVSENHDRQCDTESSRANEKKLCLLNIQQNQTDQDSGFEDTRPTPDSSSKGRYVSPYLSGDPYKKYRMGTGSSLRFSKTTTFANYDLSHRRTPTLHTNEEMSSMVSQTLAASGIKGSLESTGCDSKNTCDSPGKAQDIPNKNVTSGIAEREPILEKMDETNVKVNELLQDDEWKEREQHFV